MKKNLFIICFLLLTIALGSVEEIKWQDSWLTAVNSFNNHDFQKALTEYTSAIQELKKLGAEEGYLFIYIERGEVNFYLQKYQDAINDYSYVINHPQAIQNDIINAIWNRGYAYLASGNTKNFSTDMEKLTALGQGVIYKQDDSHYLIVQMQGRSRFDQAFRKIYIKMLETNYNVKSENIVFSPSGVVLIDKKLGVPPK